MDFLTSVIKNVDNCMGNITRKAASTAPDPDLSFSVNNKALIANIWQTA
jgi:hypothetical protein